jgi:hypothetical protein
MNSTDFKIENPRHVDWSPPTDTGYPEDAYQHDTIEALCGLVAVDMPSHLTVQEGNWKEVASENDKHGTWPENFRARHLHQGDSHECVCHSFTHNFEIAWNRQRMSNGDAVFMSPLSLYTRCNPRRWGGTYLQRALSIAMGDGILPDEDGPDGEDMQKNEFRHTLHQTSGRGDGWVTESGLPSGWKETAKHFKPLEIVNVRHWKEVVCLLLNGYAVCVGRYGHAICYTSVIWSDGQMYARYADSYRVHRLDSVRAIKAGIGGAYSIITTVIPDDWGAPAG